MSAATCCWPAAPAARQRGSPAWSRSRPSTARPTPRWPWATAMLVSWCRSWRATIRLPSCRWPSCWAASAPQAGCCSAGSTCRTPPSWCCRASSSWPFSPARRCTGGSSSRPSCHGQRRAEMDDSSLGLWGVPLAMLAGAIRVSTPFIFVSVGECLTERSGRINLGLEGTLMMGAMSAYGVALVSGSPWFGVLVAACVGLLLGAMHAGICQLPKVNDIATGIGLMLFGTGLAFFLGKPYIQPKAPNLGAIDLGWWSSIPQVHQALQVNYLFLVGIVLAFA